MDEKKLPKQEDNINLVSVESVVNSPLNECLRISAQDANRKIKRVIQRLDLLIETLSLAETDETSWSGFYLFHHQKNIQEHGRFLENSRGRKDCWTFIFEIISNALFEAEECYAMVSFEEAKSYVPKSIIEKTIHLPLCSWNCPDLTELHTAIMMLGALYDGFVGNNETLKNLNESAMFGFVVVLEDVRGHLNNNFQEIQTHTTKQAA